MNTELLVNSIVAESAASTVGTFQFSVMTPPTKGWKIEREGKTGWRRLLARLRGQGMTHRDWVDFMMEFGQCEKQYVLGHNRLVDGGTSILVSYLANIAPLTRPTVMQLGNGYVAQAHDRTRNNCITVVTAAGLVAVDCAGTETKVQGGAGGGSWDTYQIDHTFTNTSGGNVTVNEAMVRNNTNSGLGQGYCHATGFGAVTMANNDQLKATYQSQFIP